MSINGNGPLLELSGISKRFGGVVAVNECSLTVPQGTITGLIGPNGSGKTTVFNMITGFVVPDSGEINYQGSSIAGRSPGHIYQCGIGRTFQMARIFGRLTAVENLLVPVRRKGIRGFFGGFHGAAERKAAHEMLDKLHLSHVANEPVGRLSYGQRRLVELGTLMMCRPQLVLLDEPAAGVNPAVVASLASYILALNAEGVSFLVVEHDLNFVMEICHELVVLDRGRHIAQGAPEQVRAQQAVIDAYLGD
ncbi:MAG TPA: ABC transporter ATP-binding protein [Solirubrobacteraceae bacterium]|jgi:ABC-type branched-subunit amino acid transport system ATPase component|nr:ABC transporter ATP-binding protein [Solirubrobacteraceae bacterium]